MRARRLLLAGLALLVMALSGAASAAAQEVRGVRFAADVTPVSAEWLTRELDEAEDAGAELFLIELDTPGGLVTSMREIVRAITRSPVTVAVWVGPSGARAGSAGAYIAAASDVLAMAPGTNIGSATPVGGGGEDLDDKIVNDSAAYIAALASEHGRPPEPFRAMVLEQANLTAQEALAQRVIELVAPTREALLEALDGRPGKGGRPLSLEGADVHVESMPWYWRLLGVLTSSTLVYLFLLIGLAAIGIELLNPGAIAPGVVGAVLVLLALTGLAILPFNWAGIAFLMLAVALFAAEILVAGFGALAAGGVVALTIGGLMLFDEPGAEISTPAVIVSAAAIGGGFALLAQLAMRARRAAVATGAPALLGAEGEVRTPIGPARPGQVFVNGELWSARLADGGPPLERGAPVRVVAMEELTLTVEPTEKGDGA